MALRGQQPESELKCPDDCVWKQGYGFKCVWGSFGCLCEEQSGSCVIYNCGGPACAGAEDEEDELTVTGAVGSGLTLGVQLVEAGGDLFVVVDRCPGRAPMMVRVGPHTRIEIAQQLGASSDDW